MFVYYKGRVPCSHIIQFSEELYFHGLSQNEKVLCWFSFVYTCHLFFLSNAPVKCKLYTFTILFLMSLLA
jgi:hypothetical protein